MSEAAAEYETREYEPTVLVYRRLIRRLEDIEYSLDTIMWALVGIALGVVAIALRDNDARS